MSSLEKDKTYANEYPKKNKHTKSKTPPKCILNQESPRQTLRIF